MPAAAVVLDRIDAFFCVASIIIVVVVFLSGTIIMYSGSFTFRVSSFTHFRFWRLDFAKYPLWVTSACMQKWVKQFKTNRLSVLNTWFSGENLSTLNLVRVYKIWNKTKQQIDIHYIFKPLSRLIYIYIYVDKLCLL